MSCLRLLIVDDEPLIRAGIRHDLSTMNSVCVAGECTSVAEAVDAIRCNHYDLVLLDVQMSDGTGFDVIREVGPQRMPPVVFVTAYDKYALRAFEVNAVDYLLKPFDDIRLRESIERVRKRLSLRGDELREEHTRLLATLDRQQEQARRTRAELEVASSVQQKLLPRKDRSIGDVEYAGRCAPARNLSGDYYDFLDLGPGRLGIVFADVSGKGVPAALLMANLQGCFRTLVQSGPRDPVVLLKSVNRLLYESTAPENFATVFYGDYDRMTHRLRYVNCGHMPPFLLRAGEGSVSRLEPTATVLGAFPEMDSEEGIVHLSPGDALLLYSDGVTDAESADGGDFGEARLAAVLTAARTGNAEEIVDKVIRAAQEFGSEVQQDDITAVALRRLARSS
jgi:sigma-B regulation protein RsbU (phosphoserine phosphatase)